MKKTIVIGFLSLMLLVSMVVGATFVSPIADGTVSGALYYPNVTIGLNGTTNCTFNLTSDLTANSSILYVPIFNTTMRNGTQAWNDSIVPGDIQDSNDYDFGVVCYNATGGSESGIVDDIEFDTTTPTTPSSLTTATQTNNSFTLVSTVDDDSTTSCTLAFVGTSPISGAPPTGTHSGSTCTFTFSGANEGTYGYQVTASDETNTSTSSTAYFSYDDGKGGKVLTVQGSEPSVAEGIQQAGQQTGEAARNIWQRFVDLIMSWFS